MASPEGLTLADLRALVRWMRSSVGPLAMEWEAGSLTLPDGGVPSFRKLLALLDGPERGVLQIDIFGSERSVKEIRALFSAYRRLKRAERRMHQRCRDLWKEAADARR